MAEIDDLLAALVGERSADFALRMELEERIRSVVDDGSRADALRLLSVVGQPLVIPDRPFLGSPESTIILFVAHKHAHGDTLRALQNLELKAPPSARAQVVRSVLEIAVRTNDPDAVVSGLDMADRLVSEGLPVMPMASPLYWLQTDPIFPDLVLPRLEALASYEALRDEVERVRASYLAAHGRGGEAASLVSRAELRRWADNMDERLVGLAVDHALARRVHASEPLSPVLKASFLTSAFEGDVLNGGYNQYFWNVDVDDPAQAADALNLTGAGAYAELHRAALALFHAHEAQLYEFRRADTLEAFSASYALEIFDDVDDQYGRLDEALPLRVMLTEWLADHAEALADELGVPEVS
jgi:hypothetical protein